MASHSLRSPRWLSLGPEGSIEIPPHRPPKMCAAHLIVHRPQASVGAKSPGKNNKKKDNGSGFSNHYALAAIENGFLLCGALDIEPMAPPLGVLVGWPPDIILASALDTFSLINLKPTVNVGSTAIGYHFSRTRTRGRGGVLNTLMQVAVLQYCC